MRHGVPGKLEGKKVQSLQHVDELAADMRTPIRQYVEIIDELLGGHVRGLTCFGKVLTASFDRNRHTAASVLVLDGIDLDSIRRLGEYGGKLGKIRISAPLIMTPQYIQDSLDTFTLELLDIQLKHATLVGEDFFADLPFAKEHVRLQCERALKSMLMQMRQGLLVAGSMEFMLGELQQGIGDALIRTLRGYLWLSGQRRAIPGNEVVTQAEELTGRKLEGLRVAIDGLMEPGWTEFGSLYADVEALSQLVDRLEEDS